MPPAPENSWRTDAFLSQSSVSITWPSDDSFIDVLSLWFYISTSFFTHFSYFYHLDVSFDSLRVGITQLSCNWGEATLTLTFSFCISVSFSFSWAYLKIWCNIWRWFIQNFPQTWHLFHIRNLLVLQNIQIEICNAARSTMNMKSIKYVW